MESYASNEPRIGIVRTAMGACAQIAVFVFDYIPCVRSYRTHSTAVNEINVERPLRHIYELGAWLVT